MPETVKKKKLSNFKSLKHPFKVDIILHIINEKTTAQRRYTMNVRCPSW